MIKIAICDVHTNFCMELKKLISEHFGKVVRIFLYENAGQIEEEYLGRTDRKPADVLITEVNSNGINGIDIAVKLQNIWPDMKVIFTSEHKEDIIDCFRADPSYFLVKPIESGVLGKAVKKVIYQLEEEDRKYFVVTFKGRIFKVKVRDILYFESVKRTAILHGRKENWKIYRKLDDIEKELPDYFLRCHQSYLVNMNDIKTMKPFQIETYQGNQIPVSRKKYAQTRNYYQEYIGHRK